MEWLWRLVTLFMGEVPTSWESVVFLWLFLTPIVVDGLGCDLGVHPGLPSSAVDKASDDRFSMHPIPSSLISYQVLWHITSMESKSKFLPAMRVKIFSMPHNIIHQVDNVASLMTWPLWTNSPWSLQCMVGSLSMRFKRLSAFPLYYMETVLMILSSLTVLVSYDKDGVRRWSWYSK